MDRGYIERTIDILLEAWKNDSQIFVIGNGGSASPATHFACDLNKWVSDKAERKFRAFALVDNIPLVSALTNDNGWGDVYSEQLRNFFRKGDVLVAISVHGGSGSDRAGPWSQNLLKAVKFAKDHGGKIIGLPVSTGDCSKPLRIRASLFRANSTPHVEGMHLVLTHLMCEQLREKISAGSGNLLRDSLRGSALRQKFKPGAIEFGDGFLGSLVERHSLQDFCGDGHDVGSAHDRSRDVVGSSDASHNQPGGVTSFLRKSYVIPDDPIGVFPDFFRPVIE